MLDYLVNAQNAIVTGINFYIFAVIIALGTILLTDNDYSYNTIIKYGRNKLYYRQIIPLNPCPLRALPHGKDFRLVTGYAYTHYISDLF